MSNDSNNSLDQAAIGVYGDKYDINDTVRRATIDLGIPASHDGPPLKSRRIGITKGPGMPTLLWAGETPEELANQRDTLQDRVTELTKLLRTCLDREEGRRKKLLTGSPASEYSDDLLQKIRTTLEPSPMAETTFTLTGLALPEWAKFFEYINYATDERRPVEGWEVKYGDHLLDMQTSAPTGFRLRIKLSDADRARGFR